MCNLRHRFDRALRILQLLQNGEPYDPLALAVALGVHRRTVYRDISVLRELGIDIAYESSFGGYAIRGALRSGESPIARLGDALSAAMSDEQHGSSVQAIIQFVASALADGTGRSNDVALGGSPPMGVPTTSSDVRVGDRHGVANETRSSLEAFQRSASYSFHNDWHRTRDALQALSDAVTYGYILETSESDLIDLREGTVVIERLVPDQFIVTRSGVEIVGTDSWGKLVRVFSTSIRLSSTSCEQEHQAESR
ncbi:MAG: HTH domain-containing protein [Planctomycetota bacterium]